MSTDNINIQNKIKLLIEQNQKITPEDIYKLISEDNNGKIVIKEQGFFSVPNKNETKYLSEAMFVQENREQIKSFELEILKEFRPILPDKRNSMDNAFLVISDITEKQHGFLKVMAKELEGKSGKEWLSAFVDFVKETNDMGLINRNIYREDTIKEVFKYNEDNILLEKPKQTMAFKIEDNTSTIYIGNTFLNATTESEFKKDDYIIRDVDGKYKYMTEEDFLNKYINVDGSKISKDNLPLKNNEFNNLVNETNKTISNKDDELILLKEELNKMNIEMEQLKEKVNNLENKSFFRNM